MNTFKIKFKNGQEWLFKGFSIRGIYRKYHINRKDVSTVVPVGYMWG